MCFLLDWRPLYQYKLSSYYNFSKCDSDMAWRTLIVKSKRHRTRTQSYEAIKNLILEVDAKLKEYDELASQKPSNSEDNIHKDTQDIANQPDLWETTLKTSTFHLYQSHFFVERQRSDKF